LKRFNVISFDVMFYSQWYFYIFLLSFHVVITFIDFNPFSLSITLLRNLQVLVSSLSRFPAHHVLHFATRSPCVFLQPVRFSSFGCLYDVFFSRGFFIISLLDLITYTCPSDHFSQVRKTGRRNFLFGTAI